MNIRQLTEDMEKKNLSKYASLSSNTKERRIYEEKCTIRTEYQRDRDRIIHSKAFRRLKHKTQVFISPEGDHYRTRLTHTLEVSQISRTLAKALNLNEDLTEAIALGHDLGHTPFGHTGESILNEIHSGGFKHNEQSLRVVDFLEHKRGKRGLNLTYEVRDGILNHTGDKDPITLEGQIVKIADRIAYINHDIDDSLRARLITEDELPKDCIKVLGNSHSLRINNMILDIIKHSINSDKIIMSENVKYYTLKLRKFMFDRVYLSKKGKRDEEIKAQFIIRQLYDYYIENFKEVSDEYKFNHNINDSSKEEIICDYIAGMSDNYVIKTFQEIFVPTPWNKY